MAARKSSPHTKALTERLKAYGERQAAIWWPRVGAAAMGVVLSMPFWSYQAGWLVAPVLVGYLWWWRSLADDAAPGLIGWSGLGFFALIIAWMFQIHATELIQNNWLANGFKFLTFAIIVGALSSGFWLMGWLYGKLHLNWRGKGLLALPLIWLLGEWGRSWLFSVVSLGPGGTIGANWNFGSLAFPASVTPLGYAGRIVGQFGLSALVVLLACAGVYALQRQWRLALASAAIVLVCCVAGWGLSMRPSGDALRIGTVQLDESSRSDYGYQQPVLDLVRQHHGSRPLDVLLLPEYSYFFMHPELAATEAQITKTVFGDNRASLVITSRSGEADRGHKNLVTFYRPDASIVTDQEKSFLIPGGEYIPYFYEWILVLSGNTSIIQQHEAKNTVVQTDTHKAQPVAYKQDFIGSLACSGAIAPEYYRKLVAAGATVLTNSAALSTMGLGSSYYDQARQMASFLATANARVVVQSARGAQVYALNQDGRPRVESDTTGIHYLETTVQTNRTRTPYSQAGDGWVVLAAAGAVLTLIYRARRALD